MLNVADVDHLMFQFGNAIPTEAAFPALKVHCIYGVINHTVA
jgi:hypothetical protein